MRLWFAALIVVSAVLLVITGISYAVVDQPRLARLLFWLGLGGENNIGAWWSGMLLALAAFLAFDGLFDRSRPPAERRGWLALGFALLLLSFDEIASLHEYLSDFGLKHLAVLGVVGLSLASYGMQQLYRARLPARTLCLLLLAFGLLASVSLQELLQHKLQWNDPVIYGLRAAIEEGTEIVAMLILISIAGATSASLFRATQDFLVALVRRPRLLTLVAVSLWPVLVAATFELPYPGGPADWLASILFMGSGLLGVRAGVQSGGFDRRSVSLILFYVAASAAANSVKLEWDPVVLGTAVNVRGMVFALLLVSAVAVLKMNRRRVNAPRTIVVAAVIAACSLEWPSSQLLWCSLPPVIALWLYGIERKAAAQSRIARVSASSVDHEAAPMS